MLRFLPLVFLAGCYSPVRETITREYDPVTMAQASQNVTVFWTVAVICAAIFFSIWVVWYYRHGGTHGDYNS